MAAKLPNIQIEKHIRTETRLRTTLLRVLDFWAVTIKLPIVIDSSQEIQKQDKDNTGDDGTGSREAGGGPAMV